MNIVDEILSQDPNAAGLGINWHCFGSNGQETADYSRGVLERFTCRAPSDFDTNKHVKTITNPRTINFIYNSHFVGYFEGFYFINEIGDILQGPFNNPVTSKKIVINHYYCKSREEYAARNVRGDVSLPKANFNEEGFNYNNRNDEFDDGILKYRETRAKVFQLPDKSHTDERLFAALATNLSPALLPNTPQEFYAGKMETFLTCRAVAAYLRTKLIDEAPAKFFEETSLNAVLKALASGASMADARLLLSELPNLLSLPYPVVEELRETCLNIIPQMMNVMRLNNRWMDYVELDYIQRLLKNFRE